MAFLQELVTVLKNDERFVSQDGQLLKPRIQDAVTNLDADLLRALRSSTTLRSHFFKEVDEITIFDQEKFMWVVNSKEFLPDSYTGYRNKIGLSANDKDLLASSNEVSLVWPYKDCVLEGGQDSEDEKRDEVFYNETLSPDEVGRLLAPKAFRNAVRYTEAGAEPVTSFDADENLIIKGNNLLALSSLLERYEGKVKCIYIDPPYNTGSDTFSYNDRFNHSTWLTFMRNRLRLAWRLLRDDGLLFVQCDDNEQAYLRVLTDEIFGRDNFVNLITVRTKVGGVTGSSEGKSLKDESEYIYAYFKNKQNEGALLNPSYIETDLDSYIQSYKDSGKSWKYTTVLTGLSGKVLLNEDADKDERLYGYSQVETMSVPAFAKKNSLTEAQVYLQYADRIIRTTNAQSSVRARVIEITHGSECEIVGFEYRPIKGRNAGNLVEVLYKGASRSMVMRLSDTVVKREGKSVYREKIGTLWVDIQYNNVTREGQVQFPSGKKPEALIQRILQIATDPGDLVLDFHLGSGTTAAVAHKMGRRYLGIEQMDYVETKVVDRIRKVVAGDPSGISGAEGWRGGGSFVYVELAEQGEELMSALQRASSSGEVREVLDLATQRGLLRPSVIPAALTGTDDEFVNLTLDEQKRIIAELIDKNRLYINASDIDDSEFGLNESDIAFTKSFYQKGE